MFDSKRQRQNPAEPEAPNELVDDLAALYGADVEVPPEVDRAILTAARERIRSLRPAERRWPRLVLRWAPAGAAAAVAAIMVLLFLVPALQPARESTQRAAALKRVPVREDIDESGEVDILDAFVLARRIESNNELPTNWDMNGDGAVDRADVDQIAFAAVNLERSTLR